ncbi:hypothetical protein AB0K47_21780 [Streptomyces tirandamycinicus]|uniref:hypothetical protein n=1 Tax=Streptomyces TaxID=1883 RepID=UPI00036B25C5|nr:MULTISPECIES: hypothetical protein [Streptomyces]MCY0984487.1 hypothetical protein [Streptomyces tirandamycinicus]NNJ04873.1 hypothetical protein [Streptomyces sp. PKU-MA01144]
MSDATLARKAPVEELLEFEAVPHLSTDDVGIHRQDAICHKCFTVSPRERR